MSATFKKCLYHPRFLFPVVTCLLWVLAIWELGLGGAGSAFSELHRNIDGAPKRIESQEFTGFALKSTHKARKEISTIGSNNPDLQSILQKCSLIRWGPADDDNVGDINDFYHKKWRKVILKNAVGANPESSSTQYDAKALGEWSKSMSDLALKAENQAKKMNETVTYQRGILDTAEKLSIKLGINNVCKHGCKQFDKWVEKIEEAVDSNEAATEKIVNIATEARLAVRWLRYHYLPQHTAEPWAWFIPQSVAQLCHLVSIPYHQACNYVGPYWGAQILLRVLHGLWWIAVFWPLFCYTLGLLWRSLKEAHNWFVPVRAEKDIHRYYDILEITDYRCSQGEIMVAYHRQMAKTFEHDTECRKLIEAACEELSDPVKRSAYDHRYGYDVYDASKPLRYREKNDAQKFYDVLGVSQGADFNEIKRAYQPRKDLMHSRHAWTMYDLESYIAWMVLRNPKFKAAYDNAYQYIPNRGTWKTKFHNGVGYMKSFFTNPFKKGNANAVGNGNAATNAPANVDATDANAAAINASRRRSTNNGSRCGTASAQNSHKNIPPPGSPTGPHTLTNSGSRRGSRRSSRRGSRLSNAPQTPCTPHRRRGGAVSQPGSRRQSASGSSGHAAPSRSSTSTIQHYGSTSPPSTPPSIGPRRVSPPVSPKIISPRGSHASGAQINGSGNLTSRASNSPIRQPPAPRRQPSEENPKTK